MAAAAPGVTSRIRVALRFRDPATHARMVEALRDAGALQVADAGDADMVIADEPVEAAVPVIQMISADAQADWPGDVRARIPGDIAAATLGAVIQVVAAGMTVSLPRAVAPCETADAVARLQTGGCGSGSQPAAASPHANSAALEASLPVIVDDEPIAALTARERDVLAILAEGASNKAIARELGISIGTAKFHVASLIEKLGAKNRGGAVAAAIRSGLVMV
jgi:DNA-binding NarL/FixJ family response regulator